MKLETVQLWEDKPNITLTALYEEPFTFPGQEPKRRPAIIVCPGGGYLVCNAEGNEGNIIATKFYSEGYQAFILQYTVLMNSQGRPTALPVPLYDIGRAFQVIHENAGKWNVDTGKISMIGFSAGGNLCAEMAVHWHDAFLAEKLGVDSEILRPAAAILGYPVTDCELAFGDDSPYNFSDGMTGQVKQAMYETEAPTVRQLHESTCRYYISEKTPPIYVVHAIDDDTVSVMQSILFAKACVETKVPCEFHFFERGGHGFGSGLSMEEPYRFDNRKRCHPWLDESIEWLFHQLAPETKEPLPVPFAFPDPS